jgi:FAD/FMN-containing dehydrogenase
MPPTPSFTPYVKAHIAMSAPKLAANLGVLLFLAVNLFSGTTSPRVLGRQTPEDTCRCFPGDSCWPTDFEWGNFNDTIQGRLVATTPIASLCHDTEWADYDAQGCAKLQSIWGLPATHYESSSSPMAPFASNMSCDPFTPRGVPCSFGNYVRYAVNASSIEHYRAALSFARQHNLRLVIRNTGHDYMWKSTGAGSLALWTHNMRDISIVNYNGTFYQSKAVKVSAGVLNIEAQTAAHKAGLVIVGGNCPTVGLAGGYTQGGGHGSLSSIYGLSADQVLEWEVITANGDLLKATPTLNSDLYWALSGGGGGTYGIVVSLTVRAYTDTAFSAAQLTFNSGGKAVGSFYDSVRKFLLEISQATKSGVGGSWLLSNDFFTVDRMLGPNITSAELGSLLQTTIDDITKGNMTIVDYKVTQYPSYLDAVQGSFAETNVTEYHIGGHFIPLQVVQKDDGTPLIETLRFIAENGGVISGVFLDVSRAPAYPNSAHSAWREAAFVLVYGLPYDRYSYEANIEAQRRITEVLGPRVESLAPGAGAYLNEADINQPNWQQTFYGSNYEKLLQIKKKYDPEDFFFGPKAVGSDVWNIEKNGRMCRA